MKRKLLIMIASILLIAGLVSPVPVSAEGETTVLVSNSDEVNIGTYFVVLIEVDSAEDVSFYQFDLSYDPELMSLENVGDGQIGDSVELPILYRIPEPGSCHIDGSLGNDTVSGDGYLAKITFVSLAAGTGELEISGGSINGDDGSAISWAGSSIMILAEEETAESEVTAEPEEETDNEYTVSIQQSDEEQTISVGGTTESNDDNTDTPESTGTAPTGEVKWPILGGILGGAALLIVLYFIPNFKRGPKGYLD